MDRKGLITFQGSPLTLVGNEIKIGTQLPDAELTSNDMKPVQLSSYRGKIVVVSSVPSLDTPVCDMETRRFNKEATGLGKDVVILTISMDLPFAQARWCGAAGVKDVVTLSDYKDAEFGTKCGLLIKELRLLARNIFVLDREGVVKYSQLVKDITNEPNYDDVINAVKGISK